MKNIFLLFLFISFKQIYGIDNGTEPATTASDAATTEMYTSTMIYDTLPELISNDTSMIECEFEYDGTLQNGEGIDLMICGYTAGDDTAMVELSFDLPQDRWVGAGFVLPSNFDSSNPMKSAYSIIIPAYSRDIQERYLYGPNKEGIAPIGALLEQTVSISSDKYENGMRFLTLTRKLWITIDDVVSAEAAAAYNKYFNFSRFSECDDEIKLLWAFGKTPDGPIGYHGKEGQRGYMDAMVEEVAGEPCKDGTDDGLRNTPFSIITILIISFIAILIN